ncbi:MAG: hypothetical protein U9N42_01875, partial [Campylobacterota bacterium]|nr:hypothetical protein [Campylobacterota bacterium]
PIPIVGLIASSNFPDIISIAWGESPEKDIIKYNLYSASSPSGKYEKIAEVNGTSYNDVVKQSGILKYYKVTSTDKDNLESQMQDIPTQGSTLSAPSRPKIVDAFMSEKSVHLKWQPTDARATSYILIKTTTSGLFAQDTLEITDIRKSEYIDSAISPNVKYEYQLVSVDKDGLRSNPTNSISFKLEAN